VRLIYDERAVAVIGGLDARSAHLAEQIVARARGATIFVTPWASETSLTRIRIPWFFSVIPDDRRQARTLAAEIFTLRGIERVAAWVEESPDARSASEAFLGAAPAGLVTVFRSSDPGALRDLLARTNLREFGGLVLFAAAPEAASIAARLSGARGAPTIFGTLALASPAFLAAPGGASEGAVLVAPGGERGSPRAAFASEYAAAYGAEPTPMALFGHDAAAAIIEALRRASAAAPGSLAGSLAGTRFEGATGALSFDDRRGRDADPTIAVVRSGRLVPRRGGEATDGRTGARR
jgi:branched-chain amino acid transport system substrate-binding protein